MKLLKSRDSGGLWDNVGNCVHVRIAQAVSRKLCASLVGRVGLQGWTCVCLSELQGKWQTLYYYMRSICIQSLQLQLWPVGHFKLLPLQGQHTLLHFQCSMLSKITVR